MDQNHLSHLPASFLVSSNKNWSCHLMITTHWSQINNSVIKSQPRSFSLSITTFETSHPMRKPLLLTNVDPRIVSSRVPVSCSIFLFLPGYIFVPFSFTYFVLSSAHSSHKITVGQRIRSSPIRMFCRSRKSHLSFLRCLQPLQFLVQKIPYAPNHPTQQQ